ncbi:5-methylthioribose kinase [hydrothermal vent metagenome]|uniref:S-methyl-5-thioribose kinase n=1 Tax=hydrothermal vent metagenome TaxID=652676 RepID=A0A3B0TSB3_9ZZZZ
MSGISKDYQPLEVKTLGARLGSVKAITSRLGSNVSAWRVKEVGDGNLNLVFIVEGESGSIIVKQALPYVRLVGDSWPLPLKRAFFEYCALIRQGERDPGSVPEIYHFDESQAIIAMEFFTPHVILRQSLMAGKKHDGLARVLGGFCARTLFRGSDLSMKAAKRKADLALFADNVELCDITETLVFSDPYFDAERNHHTAGLDDIVTRLRADIDLKVEAQHLKAKFCNNAETMLHGDLHTGSVMVTANETKIIDPEFALYGPMGFDIGMLLANFWMAYFAQPGHAETKGARAEYQQWILEVIEETWGEFSREFSRLWRTERDGMLYEKTLFEDQGQDLGSEQALEHRLQMIWGDTLGFAGIEIIRRTLSLAHIAEYDAIQNEKLRAECERRGLELGRHLVVNHNRINSMTTINDLVRIIGKEAK